MTNHIQIQNDVRAQHVFRLHAFKDEYEQHTHLYVCTYYLYTECGV